MTALFLVVRDLRHDGWRVALSVLVVATVVLAFLATSALATTMRSLRRATSVSRNLIVIEGDIVDPSDASMRLDAVSAAEALGPDLVSRVSPVIFRHQRLEDRLVQLRAAPRANWESVHHLTLVAGRWPEGKADIVVTEGLLDVIGSGLGDTLRIYGTTFSIAGVVAISGTPFAIMWLDLPQAEALFQAEGAYQLMIVEAAPGADLDQVRASLEATPAIGSRYAVFFEDSWTRRNVQFMDDLGRTAGSLSFLSMLALVFGTYNATGLMLAERSQQFTILRALGFSPVSLRRLVALHAMVQGVGGYGLGTAGLLLFTASRAGMSQLYVFGWPLRFALTPTLFIIGLTLTLTLTALGALLAARSALR